MINPQPDPDVTGIADAEAALRRGFRVAMLLSAVFWLIFIAIWWFA